MRFLSRYLPPFLFCWLVTFTLASVLHSQFVVNELVEVGVKVSWTDRLSLTIDDWVGLLPTYGIIIGGGLLIAFVVGVFICNKLSQRSRRTLVLSMAGGFAMATLLLAMQPILNVTLIAGAREMGFYAQVLAGFVGGLLFARTTNNEQR